MGAEQIDRNSGLPPYRQLADILHRRIERGDFPGRFPTDQALAGEYGMGKGTVRKAVAILRDEGLIETHRGWGSRVVPPEDRGKN